MGLHDISVGHLICVGIYYQLIPDLIELTQAQILSRQIQNRDTEPNSKYSLKKYFQIV